MQVHWLDVQQLTMLIYEAFQQHCELCILLYGLDWGHLVEGVESMMVTVIHLLDVRISDYNVWQELKVHKPSCQPFWQLHSNIQCLSTRLCALGMLM